MKLLKNLRLCCFAVIFVSSLLAGAAENGGAPSAGQASAQASDQEHLTQLNSAQSSSNSVSAAPADQDSQQIVMNADNAQLYMTTKVYKLSNVKAVDITPWIQGAVIRNCPLASVQRTKFDDNTTYLTVNMSSDMVPMVDDMIAKLDRPGIQQDAFGSIIKGTNCAFFYYAPKYRSTQNMVDVLSQTLNPENAAFYVDNLTNGFYWKDNYADGAGALVWLQWLDRPPPQVTLRMNVYEVSDNDLIDLGIDYLRWKNGPGLDMFGVGADVFDFSSNEAILWRSFDLASKTNWAWGGFLFAPDFDASFVRMLREKGRAKVSGSSAIAIRNHSVNPHSEGLSSPVSDSVYSISFTPSFQNIVKNDSMQASVQPDSSPAGSINMQIRSPSIFFDSSEKLQTASPSAAQPYFNGEKRFSPSEDKLFRPAARLYFNYSLNVGDIVQKDVMGQESYDQVLLQSALTLETGSEKLLASYSKDYDVSECIGIPFLKDIPGLKYLFSTTTRSKQIFRYFVTVEAVPLASDSGLSEVSGKCIGEVEGAISEVKQDLEER